MSKIIDFESYKEVLDVFKKPEKIDLYDYEHPDFYEYSKSLQKEYPVLKYLCSKSKMYKKPYSDNESESVISGILSMPDLYYNYLALDIKLGNITSEFYKAEDDYYIAKIIFEEPNEYDNRALEYMFLVHKNFYDDLLDSLNKFDV